MKPDEVMNLPPAPVEHAPRRSDCSDWHLLIQANPFHRQIKQARASCFSPLSSTTDATGNKSPQTSGTIGSPPKTTTKPATAFPLANPMPTDQNAILLAIWNISKVKAACRCYFLISADKIISTLSRSSTHLLHIGFTRA